jgi:hypothetical protein
MKRLRMAAFAAVAGIAFLPGCCCFDGQLLNRMGIGSQSCPSCCECGPSCNGCNCGSGSMVGEGPMLGDPSGPFLPSSGGVIEQGPQPRLAPQPQQAQPMPAPVSTTKIKN